MEIWDSCSDTLIYKFKLNFTTYLAEVDTSTKKLSALRDYNRYIQDLPEDEVLVGELEYNVAAKRLKQEGIII